MFELAGDGRRVAKIYHEAISSEKAEKLRCMAALACSDFTKCAAWPVDTVHKTPGGPIAGIVLPRVSRHEEIHNLYSPAHRKLKYPDKDWSFLVHVGMNCAAAFAMIHSKSCVIGDVNQGNILVSANGTVFLIDCDSFQIHGRGRTFLCEVGVPQYTPPELQGRSFRGVQRTANHDSFGLAILIFHLLFMGRHPFAGRFLGRGEMPIERAISEYRFAFSESAGVHQMARPPDTLPLTQIAPQLVALFDGAFSHGSQRDGARPTAMQWHDALAGLRTRLCPCNVDRGHRFVRELASCPWCQIVVGGGPNFFISVTVRAASAISFTIGREAATLWSRIEAFAPPGKVFAPSSQTPRPIVPVPAPSAAQSSQSLTTLVRRVAAGSLVVALLGAVVPLLAYFGIPATLVFGLWWAALMFTSPYNIEKRQRRRTLHQAGAEVRRAQREWNETIGRCDAEFELVYQGLFQARGRLDRLRTDYHAELQSLERNCLGQQRDLMLQSSFISDHQIDMIGHGRKAILASYGIETAYDIEAHRILAIPGFGVALTESLLWWRHTMEAGFRFDPTKGVPGSQRQALNLKYAQLNQQLEARLRGGPAQLQNVLIKSRAALAPLDRQIALAEEGFKQADADLNVMT